MDGPGLRVENQHVGLTLDGALCRRVLRHVIGREGFEVEALTVIFGDHGSVRDLNRRYLEHDADTDVLAFSYGEEKHVLDGEIYVDLDTANERHAEFDATFEEEALRYAIHGLLHLMGYRDENEAGKRQMHVLEDTYLRETGVSR